MQYVQSSEQKPASTKWITDVAADDPATSVATATLRGRLEAVARLLPLAAKCADEDIEHVHRLRVATRRAMAAIGLYEGLLRRRRARRVRKLLRRIRRAAGDARDLDVLADRKSDRPDLLKILHHRRRLAQGPIRDVFQSACEERALHDATAALLDGVREGPSPAFRPWGRTRLAVAADDFLGSVPADLTDLEALHRFRIRTKAFRYTIELLVAAAPVEMRKEVYPVIEALQDRLGAVNDHSSAGALLTGWLSESWSAEARATLEREVAVERDLLQSSRGAFEAAWGEETERELRDRLQTVLSGTEIERKFVLDRRPDGALAGAGTRITQAYLFTEGGELRIRRSGSLHQVAVKSEGGLERHEWETEIPGWVFDLLSAKAVGRVVDKTRYVVPHGRHELEVDVYRGPLDGLVTMECEFEDREQATAFTLPDWASAARDVTEDPAYKNKNLAVSGRPATSGRSAQNS